MKETPRMQSISALIRAERESSGLSYRDLAARAETLGYSLKFQYLHELAKTGPKSWPKNPDTFRALSEIVKMPVREIILAYAVDLGLDIESVNSELVTRMPAGTDKLSRNMIETILKLIRAAVEEVSSERISTTDGRSKDQVSLAADSSKSAGKTAVQGIDTIGEEPQLARQRWRRK